MEDIVAYLETFLPKWQGLIWPSSTTGIVLVVVSAIGAGVVETTANLSAFSQIDVPGPNLFAPQMLCLDSMGELLFGVFSIVQVAIQYSYAPL